MHRIVLLTTTNSHLAGGLFNSVRNLGLHLLRQNQDITLMSYNDAYSEIDRLSYEEMPMSDYKCSSFPVLNKIGYSNDLLRLLKSENPTIVHSQGLWMYNSFANYKYKKNKKGTVSIITPRGMLDSWALKNSAFKKKIAGWLYENKNLKAADCIHALCQSEYESIRKYGLTNPIAIIPNGITIPTNITLNRDGERKTLLFIGRIHPKKGLKELLQGLGILKKKNSKFFNCWNVKIAGWSQIGHIDELKRIVEDNGLNEYVKFVGEVHGKEKERYLSEANAFILPSFSEGLPMSILEAWAYQLPVIMTDFCNIPEGFSTNSALRIEPSCESIATCLENLSSMTNEELINMGINGYLLVKEKFCWDQIAKQTIRLYDYLLNGGKKPEFVYD